MGGGNYHFLAGSLLPILSKVEGLHSEYTYIHRIILNSDTIHSAYSHISVNTMMEGLTADVEGSTQAEYSKFLFLGDSLLELWLAYTKNDGFNVGAIEENKSLVNAHHDGSFNNFFRLTPLYHNSAFFHAFPYALNLGRSGWRVQDWKGILHQSSPQTNETRSFLDNLLATSSSSYNVLVIEIGANNIGKQDPDILFEDFLSLLSNIHSFFPLCSILLLSILPHPTESTHSHIMNEIDYVNHLLYNHISNLHNHTDSLYLHYADITSYFCQSNGSVDKVYFNRDRLHLSAEGYHALHRAILDSLSVCHLLPSV